MRLGKQEYLWSRGFLAKNLVEGRISTTLVYAGEQNWDLSLLPDHYNQLVESWKDCKKCGLCQHRSKVCHFRGVLPSPFLFIGEAPGKGEDFVGRPFVGKAGHFLQQMLIEIFNCVHPLPFSWCIVNTVGCIPLEWTPAGYKTRAPSGEEQQACSTRLRDLYLMSNARVVFLLGKSAENFSLTGGLTYPDVTPLKPVYLPHPSYIMRQIPTIRLDIRASFIQTVIDEVNAANKKGWMF